MKLSECERKKAETEIDETVDGHTKDNNNNNNKNY